MTVQKTPSSWLTVEHAQWDDELVMVTPRGGSEEVVVLDDDGGVTVVSPSKAPKSEKIPKTAEVPVAAAPPTESIKMTLKGRTVVFCGMTKEEHDKEFEDGFETLLEPVVQDDQIVHWCLKKDKVARLKELIGYYCERSKKLSQSDAVTYANDIAKGFVEIRDYLLEADFLPKLVLLTKAPLRPCLHFEIIQCLSNYFHYADLDYEDFFLESEDEHLLDPPPAAIVESSIPEAIIEFLETGQEPPFLLPGKEVFVALLTLFKPLKEKLLQACTVEKLSEYLNDVDRNSETPRPFQLAPEIQLELNAFLTLYIKHRFTPLYVEEEPLSLIELQMQRLQQLKENALAALEKAVHSANLNITFDRVRGEVRLEKIQEVSPPNSDDELVVIPQSDPDSPYS